MTRRVYLLSLGLLLQMGAFAEEPVVGLPCEGCEAVFAGKPEKPPAKARLAPAGEPGQPMVLTGLVTGRDGKPRAGIVVYAYQTDAGGIYPPPAKSLGRWPDRHGRLRGWALTDAGGRYTFETIRPGHYPGRQAPEHIHMHVIEPGCATYYIDEVNFTDDPVLEAGARLPKRAGSGIATPKRVDGVWQVTRDIRLGLNIPGYPGCN
jgi:protocatechuate 3,4-dioxygenase beta subunit